MIDGDVKMNQFGLERTTFEGQQEREPFLIMAEFMSLARARARSGSRRSIKGANESTLADLSSLIREES